MLGPLLKSHKSHAHSRHTVRPQTSCCFRLLHTQVGMCILPLTACPSSWQTIFVVLLCAWLVSWWLMTCKSGHFTILSLFGECDMYVPHRRHPNLSGILMVRERPVQMHQEFSISVFPPLGLCALLTSVWCGQSLLGSLWSWLFHLDFKEGNT